MSIQRTFRLDDVTNMRIQKLSEEMNCSHVDVVRRAVRFLDALRCTDDHVELDIRTLKNWWLTY